MVPTPPKPITAEYLRLLKDFISKHPTEDIVVNFKNTKEFTMEDINKIKSVSNGRVFIRVEGGYDEHRINSYKKSLYIEMHKYDNVYTISEIERIMIEIEKIEKNINPNWSPEQKLMYFVGTLKNKIIYHPFHEKAASKDIRSLRGLFSHNTVCAGYAVILKELCDRNGIECQYVEGCSNQKDVDAENLSHAWNIVKINGNYFPLDLTWNAGKNVSGKTMSISDLANVNQFVKSHIPGKYEPIQDYEKTLKSIDGTYLTAINNLVNKDMTYELSTMFIRRNDCKVHISQVEEFVVDNKNVYKYVCFKEKNGEKGIPYIFYSTTNALEIVRLCQRKAKLESQLEEAKRKGNQTKVQELTNELVRYKHYPTANDILDKLLFSDANMSAASKRKDYFIGKVVSSKSLTNEPGEKGPDIVVVDPVFAKKIDKKQKRFKRSDGTSFVIEDMGTISAGENKLVFRYRLFEYAKDGNSYKMKKNTIFTDADLMLDDRQSLADDFLARDRIDRKVHEASGYLGYYSKNGVRTYDPNVVEYFKNGLYKAYRLRNSYVKDYVPTLDFETMKRLVKTYGNEQINGEWMIVDRVTKQPVTDPVLKEHIQFSLVWNYAAGVKWMADEVVPGYFYAFEVEDAEEIFNHVSAIITESIHKSGNIDPIEILDKVEKNNGMYKHAEQIILRLFKNEHNVKIVNSFYRNQNPSSIRENTAIKPLVYDIAAMQELSERRRKLEEQKKQLLEVVERNGQIEVVPARRM